MMLKTIIYHLCFETTIKVTNTNQFFKVNKEEYYFPDFSHKVLTRDHGFLVTTPSTKTYLSQTLSNTYIVCKDKEHKFSVKRFKSRDNKNGMHIFLTSKAGQVYSGYFSNRKHSLPCLNS